MVFLAAEHREFPLMDTLDSRGEWSTTANS